MARRTATKPTDKNRGKLSKRNGRKPKLNLDQLLTKIISLMVRHSPRELTFSRLSRLTQVPRSTLYYYFGNSTEKVFAEAARFGIRAFVRLNSFDDERKHPDWTSFQKARLREALGLVNAYPWAPALYFRFRADPGELGRLIRSTEDDYCARMAESWARFHGESPDERAVRLSGYLKLGMLMGFSVEPELWLRRDDDEAFERMVEHLSELSTQALRQRFGMKKKGTSFR